MGKLIMPKHTGERVYFQTPLKVYYDANDWVSMRDFADRLFDELVAIGKERSRNSDPPHYTKCAQLPRYSGLVKPQSAANDADAKITPRGIKVYEALIHEDMPSVHSALVEAMETMTFGRGNEGCGSDSDVEPLGVFFRCAYALDGLTGKEFGYVLGELHEQGKSIGSVQEEVLSFRNGGVPPPVPAQSLASNLADCKTLKLLKELGFIVENTSGRMVVAPMVDAIYHNRLCRLRITNAPPLKKPFKKWLEANGYGVSIESYPRSIEAISMRLSDPMSKTTGSWEGMYEYLFTEKPSCETFTVTGRLDFDARYHKLSHVLDKDVVPPVTGIDPQRHQELIDYTLKSGNSIDKGRLYCAYNAYKEFLTWFDAHKFEYGFREEQEEHMINTILTAIRTKPFILLAGISGTGKSRIVRQLARGCCPEKKDGQPHPLIDEQKPGNFELISVRPNWHDSTELMGYVTRITGTNNPKYVLTPFVKFLVKAWLHKDVPFFLCLDEMNLAPVEQYFAEYLSKVETRKLSGGEIVTDVLVEFNDEVCESAIEELLKPYKPAAGSPIPPEVAVLENAMKADKGIRIPPNLVVMGTVNMDETTCSFSRKVLDRAMSFELNDVEDMYTISTNDDPNVAWGAFNNGAVNRAKQTYVTAENLYAETDATRKATNMAIGEKVLAYLKAINAVLDKTPFKVAYRTRNEMMLYCVERGGDLAKALDEVTSMKTLSRIEGDENAVRVTNKLVESAAVVPTPLPTNAPKNLIQLLKLVILKQLGVVDGTVTNAAVAPSIQEYETLEGKYKICAAKLDEMNDRLLSGYTGFWR